jgi:hypothetical protein
LARVTREVERWQKDRRASELDTHGWVTQQWLAFLEGVAGSVDAQTMKALDERFHFTTTGNSEILCVWLRLSIQHGYAAADPVLERFLMNVGRRKFLKPLYTELAKTAPGLDRAKKIYAKARPRYHATSTGTIDKIVGWSA